MPIRCSYVGYCLYMLLMTFGTLSKLYLSLSTSPMKDGATRSFSATAELLVNMPQVVYGISINASNSAFVFFIKKS